LTLGDRVVRYRILALALAITPLGCTSDGHIEILGYTTKPLYDDRYRTIYVPVFQNRAFQSGPYRGLENELTLAVQRQIEQVTTYKVISNRDRADTELLGTIVSTREAIFNRNQLNEIRGSDVILQVELVWRDLHTGEILSKPFPAPAGVPVVINPNAPAPPVVLTTTGRYILELGESQSTALQRAYKQMAVEIVSAMEKPW
jgi:hypothetical protein